MKHMQSRLADKLNWVILITLLTTIISGIYTVFFVTPIYEASTQVLVSQLVETPAGEIEDNVLSIDTYPLITESDAVLNSVIDSLNLEMNTTTLRETFAVEVVEDTEVLQIQVENENPYIAVDIANALAQSLKQAVAEMTTTTENIEILTVATVSTAAVYPNTLQNVLIGTGIGLLISVLVILIPKEKENTINLEALEEMTGFKNLGKISTFTEEDLLILKVRPKDKEQDQDESKQESEDESLSRMSRHRT